MSDLPTAPPVRQIAYFVSDIRQAALAHRAMFRSGPFLVIDHVPTPVVRYRGSPAALDHGSAYGQWGDVMVEFVQQHDAGPSAFHDMYPRGSGNFGLHHLALWVDSLPLAIGQFERAGYACALYAETENMAFAMLDTTAMFGHMIEIYEPSAVLTGFYARIRDAADELANDWIAS